MDNFPSETQKPLLTLNVECIYILFCSKILLLMTTFHCKINTFTKQKSQCFKNYL